MPHTKRIKITTFVPNFDVLLTVHLSIILVINQLMHKFLFYNKFIICLYMFRALCAHHQEVKLYYTASGIITLCRWAFGAHVERGLSQPVQV